MLVMFMYNFVFIGLCLCSVVAKRFLVFFLTSLMLFCLYVFRYG